MLHVFAERFACRSQELSVCGGAFRSLVFKSSDLNCIVTLIICMNEIRKSFHTLEKQLWFGFTCLPGKAYKKMAMLYA